jgi:dihydrodipicolinate synthase/N-acetylneuraminate lyase
MPRPAWFAGLQSRHAVFKETLRQLGHPITARVRTPLPQITERQKQAIRSLIERSDDLRSARIS